MSLDTELVKRLRDLASAGTSVRMMVDAIRDHFNIGNDIYILVDHYLARAFFLRLLDVRNVEGSTCLGGNAYDDDQIDQLLLPLTAGTRHLWQEEQAVPIARV